MICYDFMRTIAAIHVSLPGRDCAQKSSEHALLQGARGPMAWDGKKQTHASKDKDGRNTVEGEPRIALRTRSTAAAPLNGLM